MSLRNFAPDFEYSTPMGLDTTSPIATVPQGYVREATNYNLGYSGGYSKRDGYVNRLSEVWTGKSITQGVEFTPTGGVRTPIVFGTDGTASGGAYGFVDSGTVTPISTGLSGTVRPNFVQFSGLLFFFNGFDDAQLYDGSSVRQVGITAPTSGPTVSSQTTGGSLVLLGTYTAAYTYYNSVTGAESSPSPLLPNTTLTGSNNKLNLSLTPGDSGTADTIRVYRTVANGNALFLDGTASISATSYALSVADAALGIQIELDNSRLADLAPNAVYPTVADNRIFVKSGTNEIRHSKIGQSGPMPESFEAKGVTSTIGKLGSNDDIVGINRINQLPIALKQYSIGRLDPFGLPDNTQAVDNVGYTYREISDTIGAVGHNSAVQVMEELLFLGRDNIYATDGIKVRPIADSIQATIRTLGFTPTQQTLMSAENDTVKRRVYFQVFSNPEATAPDMTIVGDYQRYPQFRWTFYEKGPNAVTHPGIVAGCMFRITDSSSGLPDMYFGNSKSNGKLYQMDFGSNDDGAPIYARLVTRPYFGGNPLFFKLFKKGEFQVQGNGNNYNATVCAIYDLTGTEEECIPLSLFAGGCLWDDPSSLWDTATWTDEAVLSLDYFMHRKAKYLQLVIKQTEADAPLELFAWGTYASSFSPNEGPGRS